MRKLLLLSPLYRCEHLNFEKLKNLLMITLSVLLIYSCVTNYSKILRLTTIPIYYRAISVGQESSLPFRASHEAAVNVQVQGQKFHLKAQLKKYLLLNSLSLLAIFSSFQGATGWKSISIATWASPTCQLAS